MSLPGVLALHDNLPDPYARDSTPHRCLKQIEYNDYVTTTNEEYDVLVTELLDEVNGVRNKYDAFSQFTEAKVAEFVIQRRHLKQDLEQRTQELEQRTQELEQRTQELEQRTQDLTLTNAQRAQIQAELVKSTSLVTKLKIQRDKSRGRVQILESSRSYRLARRFRRIMSSFFRGK